MKSFFCLILILNAFILGAPRAQCQQCAKDMRQLPDRISEHIHSKYPHPGLYSEMDGEWFKTVRITPEKYVHIYMYAPASGFYGLYTSYYPNGHKQQSYYFFGSVKIGISKFYNDKGVATEVIDEDAKFEKINKNDIIAILENENWFNRKTGENKIVDNTLTVDGTFYYELLNIISISFTPKDGENNSLWTVFIPSDHNRGWNETTYFIDGYTGEVKKESRYAPVEL